jgi:large subunit ribosomal protein L9
MPWSKQAAILVLEIPALKVLFLQNVENVATAGEVKEVRPGFARNYLLPQRLAVAAAPGALKSLELQQASLRRKAEKALAELEALAERLNEGKVSLTAKAGDQGRLYGSVTTLDLAKAIEEQTGNLVDRRKIEIAEPIRQLGTYEVTVRLSKDLSPRVTVEVVSE